MTDQTGPSWYTPGDIPASIEATTTDSDVYLEHIIDVLQAHEIDAPRSRIRTLVESTRERITERNATRSERGDTLAEPRSVQTRVFDVTDATYLGHRDLATILGIALSRYSGSFSVADPDADSVIDLLWNKQHTTVGFHVVPRPTREPLAVEHVNSLIEGNTNTGSGRSLSQLAVVGPAKITATARSLAADHDITVVDADLLRRWFQDVQLSPELVGRVLETDSAAYNELEHLIAELEPMPDVIANRDPLDVSRQLSSIEADTTADVTGHIKQGMPIRDEMPQPGKQGTLYADPSDDGDFGAFDRFASNLEEDDS